MDAVEGERERRGLENLSGMELGGFLGGKLKRKRDDERGVRFRGTLIGKKYTPPFKGGVEAPRALPDITYRP